MRPACSLTAAKKTEECSKQELSPLVKDNESTEQLQKEIERLTEKVNELEQRLYRTDKTNYENSPILVHLIIPATAKKEKFMITGITILDLKLFALYEKSDTIDVYDSQTFVAESPLAIKELVDPKDIASSQPNHCLYIVNRISKDSNCEIITFDPNDQSRPIEKWSTEGKSVRLSTYESNVIACISDKRLVLEYSSKGDLINTVRLSPGAGFEKLWHAIKLTGTNFAISHKKVDEDRHRVCIIDTNGNVLQTFEELPLHMTRMNVPICLADDHDKSILVVDSTKSRLLLLSSTLQFEKVLMKFEGCPVRICLDEKNCRIFVAEKDTTINFIRRRGCISIFNVFQARKS